MSAKIIVQALKQNVSNAMGAGKEYWHDPMKEIPPYSPKVY